MDILNSCRLHHPYSENQSQKGAFRSRFDFHPVVNATVWNSSLKTIKMILVTLFVLKGCSFWEQKVVLHTPPQNGYRSLHCEPKKFFELRELAFFTTAACSPKRNFYSVESTRTANLRKTDLTGLYKKFFFVSTMAISKPVGRSNFYLISCVSCVFIWGTTYYTHLTR